jgi:hypothetical protein
VDDPAPLDPASRRPRRAPAIAGPWRVEARSAAGRRDWFVQGFRAAGRERDEIARQLRHGQNPVGAAHGALPH